PALVDEQQDRGRDQRQQDRHDREMVGPPDRVHGSLPSTWSVPVSPREASSTTRNNAVIANPITIAVRTSACGTGSVYCDASTLSPDSSTGGALVRMRPIANMKRLTA